MMILRRKEIIAAALVVLIGMAGYLNWQYQDSIKVKDGESYVETGKKIGEAKPVMNTNAQENETTTEVPMPTEDTFGQAKSDRETARSKSLEILNTTAENKEFDTEIRKKAQEQILKTAENVEIECNIENIAKSKGYEDICVYISEDNVTITVKKDGFTEADAAKLRDITMGQIKISPNQIKIVEVK